MYFLIHTQYYLPEIGAPQARLSSLAKGLAKRGHKVTVLTAMPNYPLGKIYPGYGGLLKIEQIDGIQIIRTGIYPSQSASLIPRLFNYFSFMISSLFIGGWAIGKPDIILTESPPLFLGISGFLLAKWKHAQWIFNISDLWPESAVRIGVLQRDSLAYKMSAWLEKFLYRHAWLVTGQTRGILDGVKYITSSSRTYLFSNGVNINEFRPVPTKPVHDGFFTIVYAGLHGLAQGLDQVVETADRLRNQGLSVGFILIGEGPEKKKLVQEVHSRGLSNICFLNMLPKDQIPEYLSQANAILVPLRGDLPGAIPSKLYEAMAVERPVILIADGEPAEIVRHFQAGIVISPGDIDGFVNGIRDLMQSPELCVSYGENGRRAVETVFNREKIVDNFIDFLESSTLSPLD